MTWGAAIALISGALLTLVVTIVAESVRRSWTRKDAEAAARHEHVAAQRHRMDERAEGASDKLLKLLDYMTAMLREKTTYEADVPEYDLQTLIADIRRQALFLGNSEARRRVESLAAILAGLDDIADWRAGTPAAVAYRLHPIGRNAVAHVLSDEPFCDDGPLLQYLNVLQERQELREEENQAELTRREEERRKGPTGSSAQPA